RGPKPRGITAPERRPFGVGIVGEYVWVRKGSHGGVLSRSLLAGDGHLTQAIQAADVHYPIHDGTIASPRHCNDIPAMTHPAHKVVPGKDLGKCRETTKGDPRQPGPDGR